MLTSNRSLAARVTALVTASALGAVVLVGHPSAARAEQGEVSPTGKGIVGGALLGGEVVTIVEALAGARPAWAYVVGGGLGAVGGGIAGHFIENGSTDGKVPVYMLAGGLALVIPAIVLSLNATRYVPSDSASEDFAPTNGAAANPGVPSGTVVIGGQGPTPSTASPAIPPGAGGGSESPSPGAAPASTTPPAAATPPAGGGAPVIPLSLLHVQGGDMRLGLPIPEVRPVYTLAEMKQYGVSAQTEVRMPIVRVVF